MKKAFLVYIPVIHQGYLNFFAKYPEVKHLYILDASLAHNFRSLQKDLRALTAEQIKASLEALGLFEEITIVSQENIEQITQLSLQWIMPAEDINEQLAVDYLSEKNITWDSVFLRWDRKNSINYQEVEPDVRITQEEFDQRVMKELFQEKEKSSDWWRQTAAALVKDGKVLLIERNRHVPQDQQHYVDGDPRANFSSGVHVDIATSLHAEGAVLAQAAKEGIPTEGCALYATTFPCPYCAPLIPKAGIKTLYYAEGYSLVDGAEMMRSGGVEIVKVSLENRD